MGKGNSKKFYDDVTIDEEWAYAEAPQVVEQATAESSICVRKRLKTVRQCVATFQK